MRVVIVPVLCFVTGLLAGTLLTKKDGREPRPTPASGAPSAPSTLGSALATPTAKQRTTSQESAREETATQTGSTSPASCQALLELASNRYSTSGNIELYRALEQLDRDSLIRLCDDIGELPLTDNRVYFLRNAVFARFAAADPDAAFSQARSLTNPNTQPRTLAVVIAEVAQSDLAKALQLTRSLDDPRTLQQTLSSLTSSSATGMPAAILDLVAERKIPNFGYGYSHVFENLARQDLQQAFERVASVSLGQGRNYAIYGIARTITTENLDDGLAFLEGLPSGQDQKQLLNAMIGNIAASDPQRAIALLDSHGHATERNNLIGNIASTWMTADPDGARSWIAGLENPRDRLAAIQNSVDSHLDDKEWLIAQLETLPATDRTQHVISNFAQAWSSSDPAAASQWALSLPAGQTKSQVLRSILHHLGSIEPATAAELYSETLVGAGWFGGDDPFSNWSGPSTLAGQWVQSDPQAAVSWVESLELSDREREQTISSMVGQWGQSDPSAAAEYLRQLEGKPLESATRTLASQWGASDFSEARNWTASIEDPALRQTALDSVIAGATQVDPAEAAKTLAEASRDLSPEQLATGFASSISGIATTWARVDPRAAASWAAELPEMGERPNAFLQIVSSWSQFEPHAASEWVATFEPGQDRDAAVEGLVATINRDDPEGAFSWASTIGDPQKRDTLARQAIDRWRSLDAPAARSAVESADIDAQLREALLQRFDAADQPSPPADPDPFAEPDPFS